MRRNINNVLGSAVVTALAIAPKINVGAVVIRGWVRPRTSLSSPERATAEHRHEGSQVIERIAEHIGSLRLAGRERGGVALIMLIGFIGLAVPLTVASVQTSAQLSRNSRIYDARLTGMYNAGAGVEVALHELLSDPTFDDGLTPSDPDLDFTVDANAETVNVTVTKIFGSANLQGQGVVITKAVMPTSTPVSTQTTFTYTITIKNEGTDTVTLEEIEDYMPPGFTYVENSTAGITTDNPTTGNTSSDDCGQNSDSIVWDLSPFAQVAALQEVTLTFQADANLPNGTYYNQAKVRYDPWWVSPDVEVYTPFTAPITVGTGSPKCAYDASIFVTKTVSPENAPPGPTTFTYTISIENWNSSIRYVCTITDLLPPTLSYVSSSSSGITSANPTETWDSVAERWELDWRNPGEKPPPLTSVASGQTKTQTLQATAVVESGKNYFNEVWSVFSHNNGEEDCKDAIKGDGSNWGNGQGGASNSSSVLVAPMYDIQAIAADGSVLSRVLFWEDAGEIEILSWQEY